MPTFGVIEFVWLLKCDTMLHHHHKIDLIIAEFLNTSDYNHMARCLVREIGSKKTVIRAAVGAHILTPRSA